MIYSLIYKEGMAWCPPITIKKIDDAVMKNLKVYAKLFRNADQKWEISLDCTKDDRNVESTESSYELGDISDKWETVRTGFEHNRIPEEWNSILENEKIKEDEKMKEVREIEERQEVAEVQAAQERQEVAEVQAAQEMQEVAEVQAAQERQETAVQEQEAHEGADLPPISKDSPYVVLAQKDGFQLNMQICGDMTTMQSDGCKLYLTDMKTGKLYISSSTEITISRARLLSASDHSVMNIMSSFLVNFGDDDRKKAFARAKNYLEVVKNITKTPSSRNIQDIFIDIVNSAKAKAKEVGINGEPSVDYKYDEQEGTVAIISSQFQKLLDEVDAGCTKTVFCKKLRMIEQHYGITIVISNRGGTGYGFNDTNNRRYYKFVANPFGNDTAEV